MRKFMRKRLKKGLSLVLTFIMVFNVVFSFQMEQAHAKINVNNDKLPDGYVLVKKTDKTIAPGISVKRKSLRILQKEINSRLTT